MTVKVVFRGDCVDAFEAYEKLLRLVEARFLVDKSYWDSLTGDGTIEVIGEN